MNEQKILRKQLFKYIKYNIFMFIGIFLIFGFFVYRLVDRITFSSVNIELKETAELIKSFRQNINNFDFFISELDNDTAKSYQIISKINNPKIISIIRNEEGEIINTSWPRNQFGRICCKIRF